jgi:hypothetical protein
LSLGIQPLLFLDALGFLLCHPARFVGLSFALLSGAFFDVSQLPAQFAERRNDVWMCETTLFEERNGGPRIAGEEPLRFLNGRRRLPMQRLRAALILDACDQLLQPLREGVDAAIVEAEIRSLCQSIVSLGHVPGVDERVRRAKQLLESLALLLEFALTSE